MVKHLPHFEDLLFAHGISVYQTIADAIHNDQAQFSIKWDGTPAVVVGNRDYYNGEFISTKAFHNKERKIWTPETLANVEDENLRDKLRAVLDATLGHIPKGSIWQGDLLFWRPQSESHVCFSITPNVVTYEIPSDRLQNHKVGVVFHTNLGGADRIQSPHVYDPGHELHPHVVPMSRLLKRHHIGAFAPDFMSEYMNWCVKNKKPFELSSASVRWYLVERLNNHVESLKTPEGKTRAAQRWEELWHSLNVDSSSWMIRQAALDHILDWKESLLLELNKAVALQTGVKAYINGTPSHEGLSLIHI